MFGFCIVLSDVKEGCNWYIIILLVGLVLNYKIFFKFVVVYFVMKNFMILINVICFFFDVEDLFNKECGIISVVFFVFELCKEL